jgi:hypothetical protein
MKMKWLFFLLAVLYGHLPFAHALEPYSGSRIFWDTASRRTVFNGGGYARIIELQDGRLMAVCESGGIKIAFSQDKGSTWGAATKIVSNPAGISECVPDLIQLSDGTIIVAYNPRPTSPYSEERKFGIRCKRSTDGGQTWSDEIFVNDALHTFADGCWEPSMLELPSGEVQLYFADEGPYTTNNDQQISMCRSFDGGQSWSAPQKICYRQGFRDGMPVPVLLKDQSEIVVIIEDNGWGYGDFFPTTVRTTLQNNWKNNYWVNATDPNREKTLNLNYCPTATGGAPYLRVLPWGETVMSYQSTYNHNGKNQMRVAVGNDQARDFKAMSVPFSIGDSEQGLWNSLAVIDTGVVVAVSGIGGNIEMIKGYPVRQLQAPFASPTIDGKLTAGEGYKTRTATQILLGTQTGTRVTADMAYDRDSLYVVTRVSDRTQVASGANADGVTLMLDVSGQVTSAPEEGCYKLMLRPDGTFYRLQKGSNSSWKTADKSTLPLRCAATQGSSYYIIEVAIPWSSLALSNPPTDRRLAFTLECTDNRSGTVYTETIPDASQMRPYTWMEMRLGEMTEETGIEAYPLQPTPNPSQRGGGTYDLLGRKACSRSSLLATPSSKILIRNGKKYIAR